LDDDGGDYLVPGRECGECTICCVDLAIVADDLAKQAGVDCVHCTGQGCGIYEARPEVCRSFHCLWRRLPTLDENGRPDRSGILMIRGDPPPGFPGEHAVELVLVGGAEVLAGDRFAGLVGGFVASGTAAFLNLPAGPGYLARQAFLNDMLAPAIAARDLARVRALIRSCFEHLNASPLRPVTPEDVARGRSGEG
jgi:hypothetical protein